MSIANVFTYASSIMTAISFLTFVGIWVWAYMPSRKAYLDTAARLPFDDESVPVTETMEVYRG